MTNYDGPFEAEGRDSDAHQRTALSPCVYVKDKRIDVPAGFRLAKGPVQLGDQYLSLAEFLRTGQIVFSSADKFVNGYTLNIDPENAADGFAMLIRPDTTPRSKKEDE